MFGAWNSRRQLLAIISKQLHSRARTREVTFGAPNFFKPSRLGGVMIDFR